VGVPDISREEGTIEDGGRAGDLGWGLSEEMQRVGGTEGTLVFVSDGRLVAVFNTRSTKKLFK